MTEPGRAKESGVSEAGQYEVYTAIQRKYD